MKDKLSGGGKWMTEMFLTHPYAHKGTIKAKVNNNAEIVSNQLKQIIHVLSTSMPK